ncbi:Acyl-CoA-binding protein [Phaffia rhodozyma]|uniref:Acyl-CoA-binding protein n=1 Tax=Phaffia rhodozyma TaxID=264483 RepID=A0A0F7SIJ4_PHARH|nr:Acyl-CoA-binding protein [Phaffia rhodozyma]
MDPQDVPSPLTTAQFDRAVQVIQSLPKVGPIQSSYEEKLAMYSLYKQVTIGNVVGTRPGIFDMLKRSKWDAWKSKEDMTTEAAMKAYVRTLMTMLKRYKDRKRARDLIREFNMYSSISLNDRPEGSSNKESIRDFGAHSSNTYPTDSSSVHSDSNSNSSASTSSTDGSALSYPSSIPAPVPAHIPSLYSNTSSQINFQPLSSSSGVLVMPPDPHSPAPDVSPRLMNLSLPKSGKELSQQIGLFDDEGSHLLGSSSLPLPMPAPKPEIPSSSATPTIRGAPTSFTHRSDRQYQRHASLDRHRPVRQVLDSIDKPSTQPTPPAESTLLPPPPPPLPNAPDPQSLSLALEKIQTSLSALHERLSTLEDASTIQYQQAHPLITLLLYPFNRILSPILNTHTHTESWTLSRLTSGSNRAKVWTLVWSLIKKLFGDALFLGICFTLYVALQAGKGKGLLGRREAVRLFWKAFWRSLRNQQGLSALGAGVTGLGLRAGARELQQNALGGRSLIGPGRLANGLRQTGVSST